MDAAPEEGDEASDDETDAECADDPCPVEGHYVDFFSTFAKVGPFKAQFALYYLSKFAHSRRVRMVATAELDKRLVAGWGTGAALGKICPDLQKELPHCQKDDSAVNTRRCTLLTAILYYSAFGEAMAALLRPQYKRMGVHWEMLHLEFVLCELRKAAARRTTKIYKRVTPNMLAIYEGHIVLPDW